MSYWNAILTEGYSLSPSSDEDWHAFLMDRAGTSEAWIPTALPSARGELIFAETDPVFGGNTQMTCWTSFDSPQNRTVMAALYPVASPGDFYQLRLNGRVYELDDGGHELELQLKKGLNEICLTFGMAPVSIRFFALLWGPSGAPGTWTHPKEVGAR